MAKKVYDPDVIKKQIDQIDVSDFGRLMAEVIKEHPASNNWMLVGWAIQKITGWEAEWDQIEGLINRLCKQ